MKKFKTYLEENKVEKYPTYNPILQKNGFPEPIEASGKALEFSRSEREYWKPSSRQMTMLAKAFVKWDEAKSNFWGGFNSGRGQDLYNRLEELLQWKTSLDESDKRKLLKLYNDGRNKSKKLRANLGIADGKKLPDIDLNFDAGDRFA